MEPVPTFLTYLLLGDHLLRLDTVPRLGRRVVVYHVAQLRLKLNTRPVQTQANNAQLHLKLNTARSNTGHPYPVPSEAEDTVRTTRGTSTNGFIKFLF